MSSVNPFAEVATSEADDLKLVARARAGDRGALEDLVRRHQEWIYNVVLRMAWHPQDAEDATQEVLVKMVTKLSTFEGGSAFRTWLYRIAANHVLNMKRSRAEAQEVTFTAFGAGLDKLPDHDPPDRNLLVEDAKIGCTTAMLLCLDRRQRLAYILGAVFAVPSDVAADIMEIQPDHFRQLLSRARRDMTAFMNDKCGLVNAANPCRCAKKTRAFIQAGYVDPENLFFARERVTRVRELAPRLLEELESADRQSEDVHRENPFLPSPDFIARVMAVFP